MFVATGWEGETEISLLSLYSLEVWILLTVDENTKKDKDLIPQPVVIPKYFDETNKGNLTFKEYYEWLVNGAWKENDKKFEML